MAGQARRSDKNIGVPWTEMATRLRQMLDDIRAQIQYRAYAPVEIALVIIIGSCPCTCFPMVMAVMRESWAIYCSSSSQVSDSNGAGSLTAASDLRTRYIATLQAADGGNYGPLLKFLESP